LPGFIIGYAWGTAAGELIQGLAIRKHGVGVLRQDLTLTLLFAGSVGLFLLTQWLAEHAGLERQPWMQTTIGLLIWGGLALWFGPGLKREILGNRPIPGLGWLSRARTAAHAA
jgi:hypothetical protein